MLPGRSSGRKIDSHFSLKRKHSTMECYYFSTASRSETGSFFMAHLTLSRSAVVCCDTAVEKPGSEFVANGTTCRSVELLPLHCVLAGWWPRLLCSVAEMDFDVKCFQVGLEKWRNEKHEQLRTIVLFFFVWWERVWRPVKACFSFHLSKYTLEINSAAATRVDWTELSEKWQNSEACLFQFYWKTVGNRILKWIEKLIWHSFRVEIDQINVGSVMSLDK